MNKVEVDGRIRTNTSEENMLQKNAKREIIMLIF